MQIQKMIPLNAMHLFWGSRLIAKEVPAPEELMALCRNSIFYYALRRVRNIAVAEDIAVETLTAALSALSRYDGRAGAEAWLLGIARRKVIDHLRRQSRLKECSLTDAEEIWATGDLPEQTLLRNETHRYIRSLIEALPELQREAILLQVVEQLSIAEIAAVLSKSTSAVNSLLGRARETVRRQGMAHFREEENR